MRERNQLCDDLQVTSLQSILDLCAPVSNPWLRRLGELEAKV
jgi:hypothetical protein